MITQMQWQEAKRLCKAAFSSSLHFSIASVCADGTPHVTPIGSLILGQFSDSQGHAYYFEKFTKQLAVNSQSNDKVCILAVNSSKWFWLKSLIKGQFYQQPAVRLVGELGPLRLASEVEIARWQKRVSKVRLTLGHRLLWQDMTHVRDITVKEIKQVNIGKMTQTGGSKS